MIDKDTYTFSRTYSNGQTLSITQEFEEGTSWPVVLQDFIKFLEFCTFVGVKDKVSVEDSPFLTEEWEGPIHPPAEALKGYEEDENNAGW
jgi:hypothetical protein